MEKQNTTVRKSQEHIVEHISVLESKLERQNDEFHTKIERQNTNLHLAIEQQNMDLNLKMELLQKQNEDLKFILQNFLNAKSEN